jgi:predicted transcriptional regulator
MWANGAWTVKEREASKVEIAKLMELSQAISKDEHEDHGEL